MSASDIIFQYVSPVVATLVILTNLAEIYLIWITRINTHLNKSLLFILNLSISDLLVGVTIILVKIFYQLRKNMPNNQALKETVHFLMFFALRISLLLSVMNLLACAIIRLLAVRKPLLFLRLTKKAVIRICVGTWIISTVVTAIYYCLVRTKGSNYNGLVFPIVIVPSSIILIWCYVITFVTFRNISQKRKEEDSDMDSVRKGEIKILKFGVTATTIFMLCWLPISLLLLLSYTTSITQWEHYTTLEYSLFNLAFLNSLLNPIIYLMLLRDKGPLFKKSEHSNSFKTMTISPASNTADAAS